MPSGIPMPFGVPVGDSRFGSPAGAWMPVLAHGDGHSGTGLAVAAASEDPLTESRNVLVVPSGRSTPLVAGGVLGSALAGAGVGASGGAAAVGSAPAASARPVGAGARRAYRCPISKCGRTFRRREHLKRHIRVHTGEKPYPCNEEGCTKTFSRADNLAQHLRTHQERAYRAALDVRWSAGASAVKSTGAPTATAAAATRPQQAAGTASGDPGTWSPGHGTSPVLATAGSDRKRDLSAKLGRKRDDSASGASGRGGHAAMTTRPSSAASAPLGSRDDSNADHGMDSDAGAAVNPASELDDGTDDSDHGGDDVAAGTTDDDDVSDIDGDAEDSVEGRDTSTNADGHSGGNGASGDLTLTSPTASSAAADGRRVRRRLERP